MARPTPISASGNDGGSRGVVASETFCGLRS